MVVHVVCVLDPVVVVDMQVDTMVYVLDPVVVVDMVDPVVHNLDHVVNEVVIVVMILVVEGSVVGVVSAERCHSWIVFQELQRWKILPL